MDAPRDWRYATTVRCRPAADERVDLVFAGIDTVATIALGGRSWPAPRTCTAATGSTCGCGSSAGGAPLPLTVDLRSALEHAEAEQERIGSRPGAYPQPLNMVRKMACSFGWDWGPDLQTAGLWRP